MIFIKTQPTTLKNGLMHQIVMKEEQKTVHKKTKQITIIIMIIGLLKDEKRSKLIRNFTKSAPKIYVSIVQKNDHEIAESEFKKAKEENSLHVMILIIVCPI